MLLFFPLRIIGRSKRLAVREYEYYYNLPDYYHHIPESLNPLWLRYC